ncbi:Phytosulfokines 3 [Nymphaea thermarum]|nr:Phytosulfokines 3 [Nymphaea thermarum]
MARRLLLFIVAFLLVSSAFVAARPMPTTIPSSSLTDTQLPSVEEAEESCENLEDEDCLIRRTLVAHTDYIYTQNKGHP